MSRQGCDSPRLERTRTHTPARDALRGTLNAPLTLAKKKSWFGSLRDAVQKGALQAKAAVDSLRGESDKADAPLLGRPNEPSQLRRSFDSGTVPTPHKRRIELGFGNNNAISSLRSHLRQSTKNKRASIHNIIGHPSDDLAEASVPARLSPELQEEFTSPKHDRNSSLASSFVGSLRGLRRKNTVPKYPRSSLDDSSPGKAPTKVPLPSSPIDIPTAAPALFLDLGPTGFMPPAFNPSLGQVQDRDTAILQNPANIPSARSSPDNFHQSNILAPKILRFPLKARRTPLAPSISLQLGPAGHDLEHPPGPPTPMPGTTFQLEVDGHCSEPSGLFERGVETHGRRIAMRPRGLSHMGSLDAMAEACTVAHQNDDAIKAAHLDHMRSVDALAEACKISHRSDEAADAAQQQLHDEQSAHKEANRIPTPLTCITVEREFSSTSTADIIPSDMEELSRQSSSRFADPDVSIIAIKQCSPDPVAFIVPVKSGPPSPDRSIDLPFCPKSTVGAVEQTLERPEECSSDQEFQPANVLKQLEGFAGPSSPTSPTRRGIRPQKSASPIVFRPFLDRAARTLGAPQPASTLSLRERYSASSNVAAGREADDLDILHSRQVSGRPNSPITQFEPHAHIHQSVQEDSNSVIINYEEFKTQQLFSDNSELPASSPMTASSNGHSFIPQLYSRISSPHSSTPSHISGLSDVRDAFWRLSVNSWLGQGSDVAASDTGDRSRNHRIDSRIDSWSASTERSPISPTLAEEYALPLGSRLEFEHRRSIRNMRYNALHIDDPLSATSATAEFLFESLDDEEDMDLDGTADSGSPYPASHDGCYAGSDDSTPQKKRAQHPSESTDSIVASLHDAVLANNTLQARLNAPPETDTMAGLAGSRSLARVDSEGQTSRTTSRTFSSIQPRRNQRANRFDIFTDEPDLQSSSSDICMPSSGSAAPVTPSLRNPSKLLGDSLDDDLNLFTSPGSGYKANQSSDVPASEEKVRTTPKRYRRSVDRKALGSLSRNQV